MSIKKTLPHPTSWIPSIFDWGFARQVFGIKVAGWQMHSTMASQRDQQGRLRG